MRFLLIAVLGAAVLAGAGCRKKATSLDGLADELSGAGLKVEGFAPADANRYSAYRCLSGRVEGVEALACEYGDETASRMNRQKAEGFIGGAVTGVALERGRLVLVLSDRARVDPNGKAISRISRAFVEPKK